MSYENYCKDGEKMYDNEWLLWARMRKYARLCGIKLKDMDEIFGLEEGSMELMEKANAVPSEEILRRIESFTGIPASELASAKTPELLLETVKSIYVTNDISKIESDDILLDFDGRMKIDCRRNDNYEYVGFRVSDNSMSDVRIMENDIVIMRRQGIAKDGDIVVASAEGINVVRRYHCDLNVMWLAAEGPVREGKPYYCDDLDSLNRKIRILGKVVSTYKPFEEGWGITPMR